MKKTYLEHDCQQWWLDTVRGATNEIIAQIKEEERAHRREKRRRVARVREEMRKKRYRIGYCVLGERVFVPGHHDLETAESWVTAMMGMRYKESDPEWFFEEVHSEE